MLVSLSIKNFILIDSLNLDFNQGLCVLSGETGAGKSIILDALGLALGRRANAKLIKSEGSNAVISAAFNIEQFPHIKEYLVSQGFELAETLILRRVLEQSGKTKCYVNDILSSVAALEAIGELLVEISSQHDQKGLFNTSHHRLILDEFSGNYRELEAVGSAYKLWKENEHKLNEIIGNKSKAEDERNYLTHIIQEISELNPKVGEEEYLSNLRNSLREKAKIQDISSLVLNEANSGSGIVAKLNNLIKALTKVPNLFKEAEKSFEIGLIEINEGIAQVEKVYDTIASEKFNLNSVEERLFNLKNIARKYGVDPNSLEEFLILTKEKLDRVSNYNKFYQEFKADTEKSKLAYLKIAEQVSIIRKQNAIILEKAVKVELEQLKMGYADFMIESVTANENEWAAHGIDKVRFLARTNPGSEFGYINKIASGGELSRLFLSLRVALSKVKSSPSIIFDEIDVGVGGAVADSIGKKLKFLSGEHQVLVITHQPQVAAYSDNHYLVSKNIINNKANVDVKELTYEEKLHEIARMLSGEDVTRESVLAAETLIKKAK
ncbi:hypothetical protein NF27_BK00580 [Candidatus Jidaibacter acanthamoeba]|uniref:DNA repair protein RecN n=1 Tax=Candidatus Jidaibacter acanthamoebae TaxID=86105 RepID=A0A0C1MVC2_9RICK|nr:DNA repair protein RecN [Candidatus Jidaibacter acanthamoeba]KIE06137.1 hypothetical protein NF27_BK00580 [Candidatus Jidaibacter acanthamoeba]